MEIDVTEQMEMGSLFHSDVAMKWNGSVNSIKSYLHLVILQKMPFCIQISLVFIVYRQLISFIKSKLLWVQT